jgi:hypothetical protein
MNRKPRDPVQMALRHIQSEVDFVLDHHGSPATQHALADALVEVGVGLGAARPARPPMSLADLTGRPEPEPGSKRPLPKMTAEQQRCWPA